VAVHPRVTYLYEVSSLWRRVFADGPDDRLPPEAAGDVERIARLYEEFAARLNDPARDILVEKNPKHTLRVGFLARAFPGCRLLHIVRDGRDTVASLMFRNRGREWGHLRIPGWAELLERFPEKNHLRCAYQWRDSVRLARQEGAALAPDQYREVRFEELLLRPAAVAQEILDFLGLEVTPDVLRVTARIQDSTEGSYHARRQVRHYLDNHRRRIGRYEENLTPEQLEEVTEVCGDLLRELGYL
jgi:hypothetical protein